MTVLEARKELIAAMHNMHADQRIIIDLKLVTKLDKAWDDYDKAVADAATSECEAWRKVAVDSNKAIDAFLRRLNPQLPEHYGMPLDGIQQTLRYIIQQLIKEWEYRKSVTPYSSTYNACIEDLKKAFQWL